jgi:hypothetical protein
MMKSAIRNPESVIPQRQGRTIFPFSAVTALPALFLVTMMICSQARAQARSSGSPTGQKSPEQTVPASEELLRKALKNAKAVAPEDTLKRAELRTVETKAPKLLPDGNGLPDGSRPNSQKPTPLNSSKDPAAKPEAMKQDKGPDAQPDPEKAVHESDRSLWEPTGITVSRVFLVTDGAKGEARKIPMNVPVLYESRLLALDKDKQRAVARLLDKLVIYRTRLAAIRKEGADLLAEWNQIVSSSTPQDLLLSDSPTLIEKGGTDATGHGENAPGFEPGKGVSVEMKSTAPN